MARKKTETDGVNFKKHTFKINEKSIEVWVKVNNNGKFFFELPHRVAEALGRDSRDKYEFAQADKAGYALSDFMKEYRELSTTHTYHIRYRLAFSNHIKNQIPDSILPPEECKKVRRVGSEYFPDDALSLIMYWYPIERTVHGKGVVEKKLKPADQDDIDRAEEHGSLWKDMLHKPYEGVILKEYDSHWISDENVWFEVDLTKETYEFFQMFEDNFIKMIAGIFKFLNKDKQQLLADIQKSMANLTNGGGFKLLEG